MLEKADYGRKRRKDTTSDATTLSENDSKAYNLLRLPEKEDYASDDSTDVSITHHQKYNTILSAGILM